MRRDVRGTGRTRVVIDQWSPVTHDLGLIDLPVDRVVDALNQWHAAIGTAYTHRHIAASLASAFEALPPLSMEKRRRLFIATRAGWTACFQSGIAGSDPFPAMSYLAQQLGVLAMRVCATASDAVHPATVWEVYAPESLGGEPPLGYRRSISAVDDGGRWKFSESGERFDFEKPERYQLRRTRDRFDRALLEEYLAHFCLAPFDDDFYAVTADSPAVLLETTTRWPRPAPEFTLEQVRLGLPWKPSPAL